MPATPPEPASEARPGSQDAGRLTGFVRELDTMIRARYPLIYLVSWEEQRLDAVLEDLARRHGRTFYSWSITQGLRKLEGARSMVKAMDDSGKLLQIGHQRRSNPRYLFTLEYLFKKEKLCGQVVNMNGQWNRAVGSAITRPKSVGSKFIKTLKK